jgi:hypothetical protein
MPQDVFVLVKGSQVWSEPRPISIPGSKMFEWGMLLEVGEESTLKE